MILIDVNSVDPRTDLIEVADGMVREMMEWEMDQEMKAWETMGREQGASNLLSTIINVDFSQEADREVDQVIYWASIIFILVS